MTQPAKTLMSPAIRRRRFVLGWRQGTRPRVPVETDRSVSVQTRRRLSIGAWIGVVSLGALLPMLGFSVALTLHQIRVQQMEGQEALQRRGTVAAAAIAHELQSVRDELSAITQADSFLRGDLPAMHRLASRLVKKDSRLAFVTLGDASGDRVFTTLRPYGEALPSWTLNEALRRWFETRKPRVSALLPAPLANTSVVALAEPVSVGDRTAYALVGSVRLEAIAARLNEQAWPADWTASVIDQNNVILARSRDADQFIGKTINSSATEAIKNGRHIFQATTNDGVEVIAAAAGVPGSEWHVLVGQPIAALNAQVRNSMAVILVAGLMCSLAGIGGSLFVSHLLGRQLRRVVDAHVRNEAGVLPHSTVREVIDLETMLKEARDASNLALSKLQASGEEALAQMRERSEMLDVLAHEVRQPLNNASAALQAASTGSSGHSVDAIGDPIVRARTVIAEIQASIDNTLTVAALLARGERIPHEDTDVDALIGVAIADMPPAEVDRVRVERETTTRTASMDSSLMRLALRNLLSNALKFSASGTPVIVRIADSDEPLALLIDVVDQGPGIDAEMLPRIFSKGSRRASGSSARDYGLGLYIVRRVMELHGSSVRVERSCPQGTTMRLAILQGQEGT